ncbi:MAG TPA: ribbon-helix-helix protein, CopG family [Candidatus Atribacteria bacterium]|nr:ribbon-helix-helix protein, CopG family [Candidatus Atribacteria bacterium]
MKIVTVNVPDSYVDAMEKLVGEDGLYPSRSELIRCAVREFLIKELELAKKLIPKQPEIKEQKENEKEKEKDNIIRVPININGEMKLKEYRVIRKLDNSINQKLTDDLEKVNKRKRRKRLGNIWYDNIVDRNGNLIRERYMKQEG